MPDAPSPQPAAVDPAALEVFRHRVAGVAEAMGAALRRAAYSPNIKERADLSCAVFDGRGRLLAQAAHIPVHLGAMPDSVAAARRARGAWAPGDVVVLNDPSLGGSHLPDLTTVSPVYGPDADPAADEPALFVATRAHHADVGGAAPGSLPLASDLVAEGLVLPPVRLVRAGTLDEDVRDIITANTRTPAERRGDLDAQLAAHRTGTARLEELLADGRAAFDRQADALIGYGERRARAALRALPEGTYSFEDALDGDGRGGPPLALKVALTLADGTLTADFAGSARQARVGVNAPLAVTRSAVRYVVACLLEDGPINHGVFAPVTVRAPHGSIVNPGPGAAVAAGNVETSQRVVDVVLGALADAAPDRIPAASQGTMNNLTVGGIDPRRDAPYTYYETLGGGAGAAREQPGASAIQVHMTNTANTPIEALETAYPLRVERYAVRDGSGGAGRWRGGDGLERALRFLAPATVTLLTERRTLAPWGLAGGHDGTRGENILVRADGTTVTLPGKGTIEVEAGDLLVIRTPGGGGWGAPETEDGC